jgi:integrase
MASVRKRATSSIWTACITLPDGTRKQFSTGFTDKDEALAAAVAAERATGKQQSAQRLRASLDRIADDYIQEQTVAPGPWLVRWAERRRNEVSPRTFEKYEITAKEASAFLEEAGLDRFSKLSPEIIEDVRDQWAASRSASTANGKLKILRMALKRAVRERLIDSNPAEGVENLKVEAVKRREFRPDEIESILPTLSGEWKALFLLGLHTGQRLNDLALLEWRNLDLQAETLTFVAAKTSKTTSLPLLRPVLDALEELPTADTLDAPVFPTVAKKNRTTRSNEFRTILASVGLARPYKDKGDGSGRRQQSELSFHSLRHTFTSNLKAAGVSDSVAMAIVGHDSPAVSAQYTHLDLATMKAAMKKTVSKS